MLHSKFANIDENAFARAQAEEKEKSIFRKRFLWALAYRQKVRDQTKLKLVKSLKGLF